MQVKSLTDSCYEVICLRLEKKRVEKDGIKKLPLELQERLFNKYFYTNYNPNPAKYSYEQLKIEFIAAQNYAYSKAEIVSEFDPKCVKEIKPEAFAYLDNSRIRRILKYFSISLQSLDLRTLEISDFTELKFDALKELDMSVWDELSCAELQKVLKNAPQLEALRINNRVVDALKKLHNPMLKKLMLLGNMDSYFTGFYKLSENVPQLEELELHNADLQLCNDFNMLKLSDLQLIACKELSNEVFDKLSKNIPHLKKLDISCSSNLSVDRLNFPELKIVIVSPIIKSDKLKALKEKNPSIEFIKRSDISQN